MNKLLASKIFNVSDLPLIDTTERVVKGGRDLFPLLGEAFKGVKQIGFIGWGSQGPSQAQNLRDSLAHTDIKVSVGLREGSSSFIKAEKAGFSEENGTLGEMYDIISSSDIVILLISDSAQSELYTKVMSKMKSGATLGLSHGFLLGHMQNNDTSWRKDINVIMVAPKGMGPSLRNLYIQGKEVNGAGINSSIAIEQDFTGDATDYAIAWAVAIGSPYIFQTTMTSEYKSDIFGERGDLLGGVWAMTEVLYDKYCKEGMSKEQAFINSTESITGPISRIISEKGLLDLYSSMNSEDKKIFKKAYGDLYEASSKVLGMIYDEVSSGREIKEVITKGEDLKNNPMEAVDSTPMWEVGKTVRAKRIEEDIPVNPYTAGAYVSMIMAQVNLLKSKNHPWSEIANESVIEATDSLNPYMHKNGVAFMVDGCSVTARLGTRKWGPIFQEHFISKEKNNISNDDFDNFCDSPIHEVLQKVGEMRPSVKISL